MKLKFSIFFLFVTFSICSFSQTKAELRRKRQKYQAEIKKLNKLLFAEEKKEQNALEHLKDLNQKIELRNKLINAIQQEANALTREISKNSDSLQALNKNLKVLKEDYSKMIYKSYKSKSQQSRLMFLLSSDNFYQAYKRIQYMKQYANYREKQGEEIIKQAQVVEQLNDSLKKQKKIKNVLLLSERDQKATIELDKKQQESLLSSIKKKEKQFKKQIQNSIKEEKRIAKKIDDLIKEEIRKANLLAAKNTKGTPSKTTTKKNEFILSPEAKALANRFEQNKGNLPWPLEEGLIVRRYGVQPHPTFPGITIKSTGIHFVTASNNNAEAIFNGEVLNILVNSRGTKNIMIRHGNYISSYANIETSFVKKGDKVTTGQQIGKIFTDKVSGKTTLIFSLFKNTTRLNPSSWILKR